jgi:hypothetical protein
MVWRMAQGLNIFFFLVEDPEKKRGHPETGSITVFFFFSVWKEGGGEIKRRREKSRPSISEDFLFSSSSSASSGHRKNKETDEERKETLDTLGNCDERTQVVYSTHKKETVLRWDEKENKFQKKQNENIIPSFISCDCVTSYTKK